MDIKASILCFLKPQFLIVCVGRCRNNPLDYFGGDTYNSFKHFRVISDLCLGLNPLRNWKLLEMIN